MEVNYLTLGYDCSPAAALNGLNLRKFALPFDWVVSSVSSLEDCFRNNFDKFHKNLVFKHDKKRLIDYYKFEFPHDYPLNNTICNKIDLPEFIAEEYGKCISDTWVDHYNTVLEKYNRRIQRFKGIINDTKTIIVLCRYSIQDVLRLQRIFIDYYKKENVFFVNSSKEVFENDRIINIYTEKNNIWNDVDIWKMGVDKLMTKILHFK